MYISVWPVTITVQMALGGSNVQRNLQNIRRKNKKHCKCAQKTGYCTEHLGCSVQHLRLEFSKKLFLSLLVGGDR